MVRQKAQEIEAKPWYPKAVEVLEDDWDRMVTFFAFSEPHWKHLTTTNIVESPFASVRLPPRQRSGSRRPRARPRSFGSS
jgi:transposase-like protein